jgi:MbtH protein
MSDLDAGWPAGTYQVLVNEAGQYSLFPAPLPIPGGWRAAGFSGSEDACVAFVDRTWTDITPAHTRTVGS